MTHSKRSTMTRLMLPGLAILSVIGAGSVYAWQRQYRQNVSRVRTVPCLRQEVRLHAASPADEAELWQKLREGGRVLLVRHALTTPGNTDPANFDLNDRTTQRNLSDEGRKQAETMRDIVRTRPMRIDAVYSSEYFRCRETAEIVFGSCKPLSALNALADDPAMQEEHRNRFRAFICNAQPKGVVVLVTHTSNIAAITPLSVSMGNAVVLKPSGSEIVVEGVLKLSK